jgi:hypothetical protein
MNASVRVTSWVLFGIAGLIAGIGIAVGILWFGSAESAGQSSANNPASSSPVVYKNFLLVQVDSTSNDKASIESIWLLRFPVNRATTFEVFSFHPSFFKGKNSIPQDIVQRYVAGTVTSTIVFDRANLSDYVDRLGGITVAGQAKDGAEVWRYLDTADVKSPNDLSIRQTAVAHSILIKMAVAQNHIDFDSFMTSTSPQTSYAELLAVLQLYYPLRVNSFRVHLVNPS